MDVMNAGLVQQLEQANAKITVLNTEIGMLHLLTERKDKIFEMVTNTMNDLRELHSK